MSYLDILALRGQNKFLYSFWSKHLPIFFFLTQYFLFLKPQIQDVFENVYQRHALPPAFNKINHIKKYLSHRSTLGIIYCM